MTADSVTLSDLEAEAHVWLARPGDITGPEPLDSYVQLLSADEQERHKRFHFDIHRKLYLVSHALVRTTLSRYADVAAGDWIFSEGEFGRPEVSTACDAPPLRFNLSHTEGLAACIVCLDSDCGVDVERLNRVKDLAGVAKRVLTPPELEDLLGRSGDSLEGRFVDYWTLKEAYMKARGKGFQLPPRTFTIRLADCDEPRASLEFPEGFDDEADNWQMELSALPQWDNPSYRLGVAVRRNRAEDRRVVVRHVVPH